MTKNDGRKFQKEGEEKNGKKCDGGKERGRLRDGEKWKHCKREGGIYMYMYEVYILQSDIVFLVD